MNDDLISRSALRKAVNDFYDNSFKGIVSSDLIKYAEAVDELIDDAPTIEERPKGIYKPKSCSKCKYHHDCPIEDEPCKSCIAYSNYEDMRGDV